MITIEILNGIVFLLQSRARISCLAFWPYFEKPWGGTFKGHVKLTILPEIQIECSLPHALLGIEHVNHGRSQSSF